VIAWQSRSQDGSYYSIYAQRYNATGVAQGGEFQVNTYTTNRQKEPSIAMDGDGDFVVVWESGDYYGGQDGSDYGVYAQRYNAAGVVQGAEFQVNTYTTDGQRIPSIAMDDDGEFVIAWQSGGGQDGSNYGVFAQRYGVPLVVNSTGDGSDNNAGDGVCDDGSGNCTLRAALEEANATVGIDNIHFDIPGAGPHTIQSGSALPVITDPVVIDGTTDPDFGGTPIIELDGTNAGTNTNGLHITAGGSTLKGLVINRFEGVGIRIESNGGNYIQRNYIGTDPTGTIDFGNGQEGISIGIFSTNASANGNYIGTDGDGINDDSEGNLISGNGRNGILVAKSDDNTIAGNFIGTDATGKVAIPNNRGGINGCENTVIGTDGDGLSDELEGNLISGNSGAGVLPRTNCIVAGNYIGTDVSGLLALPNGSGILFTSSPSIGASFNRIGTNADGISDDLERNVISGNGGSGILIAGEALRENVENIIAGNYIGTDATGTNILGFFTAS